MGWKLSLGGGAWVDACLVDGRDENRLFGVLHDANTVHRWLYPRIASYGRTKMQFLHPAYSRRY